MVYLGKFDILKTEVTACDYDWLVKKIFKNLRKKFVVAPVASHPITLAYYDKDYQKALNKIDMVIPDSQYVRWALRFLYGIKLKDRVYGPELFLKVCDKAQKEKRGIFLVGNSLDKLIKNLKKRFPSLIIVDYIDLHHELLSGKLIKRLNQKLKKSKANLIFIGIGSPNQHKLAVKIKVSKPIICIGAVFDFIAGTKKQAPKIIQKFGLEWGFRLINEPRLFKRYFFYSLLFMIIVCFKYFKNRSKEKI